VCEHLYTRYARREDSPSPPGNQSFTQVLVTALEDPEAHGPLPSPPPSPPLPIRRRASKSFLRGSDSSHR